MRKGLKSHAAHGVLMGPRSTEMDDQPTADNTPEDVAVLYSWANLQGANYRDYSASRREYRAQVRYKAARAMLERELKAQVEAAAAAAIAEREAVAERVATPRVGAGTTPVPATEESDRIAAAERLEAARRTESAARAAVLTLREEREIAEAHTSATRQAQVYEESEARRRRLAGPQPNWPLGDAHGELADLRRDHPGNVTRVAFTGGNSIGEERQPNDGEHAEPPEAFPDVRDTEGGQNAPAWLSSGQALIRPQGPAISQTFGTDVAGGDTLQDSRERVAARWFALKNVFNHAAPELPAMQPLRTRAGERPLLAVFSLSGGVGKTSLLATLGRALSAEAEKVAVADTTAQGLLPIYFGSDQARGRGLAGAAGGEVPISLSVHDVLGSGEHEREVVVDEILQSGQGSDRLLIDVATGASWLVRRLVELHPTVLVPVAPDMNSVISMQAIERQFRGLVDAAGRALLPFYVLNQFDAALPLHLDVREVFRRQLGDRLLPYAICRSPLVSEALAEGMTVFDYAPDARVSLDYKQIANWLRSISPPAAEQIRGMRWGER